MAANTTSKRRARDPTPSQFTESEAQPTVFAASEARANFMEVVGRVRYGRERLVITNKGKAAAAIVTMEDLKLLQLLDDVDIRSRLDVEPTNPEDTTDFDEVFAHLR